MEALTPLEKISREWAAGQLASGSVPAQVDLDNLSDDRPPADAVFSALSCVEVIRQLLIELAVNVDVAAVIPLEANNELIRSVPTLATLSEFPWNYGPGREVPGIYLVPPSVWEAVEPGEEYRRTLTDPHMPRGFIGYYRTWRTDQEIVKGWEFSRAIYIRSVLPEPLVVAQE